MALGAMVVLAIAPQVRQPMMDGMGQMGGRVRKMMRGGADMVSAMMPGDAD